MALSRIKNSRQHFCKSMKLYSQHVRFQSHFAQKPSFSLNQRRPICIRPENNTNSTSDHEKIAFSFVSIFTRQPFSPDYPELRELAPKLTTKVVETTLSGFKRWGIAYMFFTWASNQVGYRHDIYAYNAMASILSRVRQNALMKELAGNVVNSRCLMSPGALGFLIRCFGSAGLVEEAGWLFDQVKTMGLCVPNVYSYNCLLEAVSKSGSVELVEMRLNEMIDFGCRIDKYTLTPVLQVYCNTGKFDRALSVFNEINDHGWVDVHVLTILVVSLCKWGEVDKAFELIERTEECGIILKEKTFFVLINGFVRQSRMDKACQMFDKMQRSGFVPDVALYDVMIRGFCEHKEREKALSLYSDMKRLGIRPDNSIIENLISSFSKGRELIKLVEEIREDLDLKSTRLLYNSVLEDLVNNNSVEKAYDLLLWIMGDDSNTDVMFEKLLGDSTKRIPPDTTTFSIVINGLLKSSKLVKALIVFQHMIRIGCKPTVLIYNNIIDGLCQEDRMEESYELLRHMKEAGFEPTQFTMNSIYGCLCRREDVEGALDMVRKMRIHGTEPWIKHSTLLVKKLSENGKAVEACKFLTAVVQEGFLAHIVACTAAMDGLIKIGLLDQALTMFRDIFARGYCPDVVAYNILIRGLCRSQRVGEARDLLNEMMSNGLTPSVITYNLLIDGYCKNGYVDHAMLCISRMFENENEPDALTCTTLVNGLCSVGRPNDALRFWNVMVERGFNPDIINFMGLIQGLCKCNMPCEALIYFHEMEVKELKPDSTIYLSLISAFLSDANVSSAFDIFKKMVHKGEIPESHDKNYSTVKKAMIAFLEDKRTCSSIKNLIEEGKISAIEISDTENMTNN